MRSLIGVLLLSSSTLACIGGSSGGGGGCCASAQSSCAPSAPPCGGGGGGGGAGFSQYASSGGSSYPRPPISSSYGTGAGGSYAAPPAPPSFNSFPSLPSLPIAGGSLGGGYQQAPLSLPSNGFNGVGGGYQTGPSAPLIGGGSQIGGGSYQAAPLNGGGSQIGGGSYQAAPILSQSSQQSVSSSYQTGPSAPIIGGSQIGGGSYTAPAAVITTIKEEITAPVVVAPVAPTYGEKAVINNGPQTITKQTQTEVITDEGYGAKEEEYEEVEQVKVAPTVAPVPTYERPATVETTIIEKTEEKIATGGEATEYEYEEEEKTAAPTIAPIAPIAPIVATTDNYKAAAVQQNGQTEHASGSEAALSNKEEPSAYSAEEQSTVAGASYEAVEQDGEQPIEAPKQVEVSPIAQKAEAETTYDDDEGVKKTEEEKKEEYKRNTIKRNSARRA